MYKKQFFDSLNTTNSGSIILDGIPLDEDTRSRIYSTIQNQLGQFSAEEVSQKCFWVTSLLKNELEKLIDTKLYYTLGYINLEGKPVFHTDLDTLKGYIGQDVQSVIQAVNLHAWLTTSGGEIIDATLMTTLGVVRKQPEMLGGVIASFNESLTDLSYHPQIIGEEYLKDCGFMVDFEFWELA
ncbi:hypothetical protein ACX03_05520 [Vibrio parahaemolyticus]|uniref:hypothetical protein n=1 Tax=Vibrio diabolicus TaxID=50719 RepID=UPI0006B286B3|nr:hypothetical protein [Vibrio diabolicus]KOY46641.1 hypothetical protein ACX03_05520 [Vibrio parahaemolyticus]MCS0342922.1 hypothetical protein [Vibrio diabolicus]MDF4745438.1 hypothetical protein [Vibrio parahaemolyticus]